VPGRTLRGGDLGPTRSHDHQTFRARKDGTATALPLPPLLDPVVVDERAQWEKPKERAKHVTLTPFQRQLWENSFAHALASPVRQCRLTQVLLPVALLASLHARPHPTTQDPWLLPVSLTTDKKHLGPPLYFLNRRTVVRQLGTKKTWEKILGPLITDKFSKQKLSRMVWREDMPDLILSTMRNKAFAKLSWSFGFRGRLIPVPSPRPADIEHVDNVSYVLFFGSLRSRAEECHQKLIAIQIELDKWANYSVKNFGAKLDPHASPNVTHPSPHWYTEPLVPKLQPRQKFPELEFHTTTWRGRKVPVYSLTDLLGEEKAQELAKGSKSKYEEATCVVMKRARTKVAVDMLLMHIQAYITQCGP